MRYIFPLNGCVVTGSDFKEGTEAVRYSSVFIQKVLADFAPSSYLNAVNF